MINIQEIQDLLESDIPKAIQAMLEKCRETKYYSTILAIKDSFQIYDNDRIIGKDVRGIREGIVSRLAEFFSILKKEYASSESSISITNQNIKTLIEQGFSKIEVHFEEVKGQLKDMQENILARFDQTNRALLQPVINELPVNQTQEIISFYDTMPMEKMHEAVLLLAEIVHNEVILVKEDILIEMKKLMLKSSEDSIQLKSKFELGLPFLFKIEAEMNMNKYLERLKRLIPHNLGGKLNH